MTRVISKKSIVGILIGIFLCMVIGSFYDYQISQNLYNESNWFGIILAAYGQAPTAIGMSIAGVLLLYTMDKNRLVSLIPSVVFGILLILFGIFMATYEPHEYLPQINMYVLGVIATILVILSSYCMIIVLKGTDKKEIRKYAYFIIFFALAQVIVINIIKVPWARPRMRFISAYPDISFQNWWIIGSDVKEYYLSIGVGTNEFKSFPSGHTASALCIFFIMLIPVLNEKYHSKKNIFFTVAIIFTILVALSRIIMGAHFLTDVTMGFLVSFIIFLVGLKLFYNKFN